MKCKILCLFFTISLSHGLSAQTPGCADAYRQAYDQFALHEFGSFAGWITGRTKRLRDAHALYQIAFDHEFGVQQTTPELSQLLHGVHGLGRNDAIILNELVTRMKTGDICHADGSTMTMDEVIQTLKESLYRTASRY